LLQDRRIDWRFDDFGHFDHRKVVVIDGRVGYVGGPGIEDHYATGTHDLMLRLEGPIVAQLQALFLLSWHYQGGPLPASGSVRHWFEAMRDAGVDLREHPQMAHAKVVLADDVVLAGTANLDALSLRQNWELQLRIDDATVADRFARELFDRDVELTTPAVMPQGWRQRAINRAMSAISPLL